MSINSYHNFLFPFRFDKVINDIKDRHEFYKTNDFSNRVVIDDEFKKSLEKDNWQYEKFEIKNNLDYNEIVYFYDFVKDSLFNTAEFKKNATSYYFEKILKKEEQYIITLANGKSFELSLTGINLRIFDTGVGILSFELENHKYQHIKDILLINEYGRRIYPEFLGEGFSISDTQNVFLAQSIEVMGIKEDFTKDYKQYDIQLANFIVDILGKTFTTSKKDKDKYFIQPLFDDRMFTICWYGNDKVSKIKQNYIKSELWYKFVYLDGQSLTVQDEDMQENLIEKVTYSRWKNYGTLYGITRYSFVCLSSSLETLKNNNADFILNHIKTMYFQMVILSLALRASIIRFSDEVTAISDIEESKDISLITQKISNLYKNYLRFKNKLYFKEITPQEQGIEIYDKMRDIMRIDSDIGDLSMEIQTLNSYAFILEEKEEKEQMNKLTKLGTIFLPPTLIAGIFGMNIFPDGFIDNIGGWTVTFGSMFGLTWWLSKIHDINIKEFFIKKDKKNE